jgi:hypothetical protein
MLRCHCKCAALVAAAALASVGALAEEWDPTGIAGEVFESFPSVVAYTPACEPVTVRVWIPFLLDEASSLLNNAEVYVVSGDILGGVTTFGTGGNPNLVSYIATADVFDDLGGYTSSNVVIDEGGNDYSDTLGQILPNGRLVYRANYAGTAQNNLEEVLGDVKSQLPAFPEPRVGNEILDGPGTSGDPGDAYLGNPAAMYVLNSTDIWVANTNYDAGSGDIPTGANIWRYDGTPQPAVTPDYTYTQADAETFANDNGVSVDPGDGRQTQPVLAYVEEVGYIVFGINDTDDGGSARPGLLCVDAFEDDDAFVGAVPIVANAGERFIDHQANGGGAGPHEGKHFDMNSAGQIVVVAESDATVPTYKLYLYNPVIDQGRITDYQDPIRIADAGPIDDLIDDGLAGPIMVGDPPTPINAISGVGINDAGNIGFTATWDMDDDDPNTLSSAAYFYDAANDCLHQVLRAEDTITYDGTTVRVGLIPQEDSDSFFAPSLADNADVMAFNFRPSDDLHGGKRGVVVVAVGHQGDTDFDGDVDHSDLGSLLAVWGASFGESRYEPEIDFDLDGTIGHSDLGILLANWNP